MRTDEFVQRQTLPERPAPAGHEDQSTSLSGDGIALHALAGSRTAPEGADGGEPLPRDAGR